MFRSIFLFVGLVTIITAPFVYWKLDNDIPSARFLSEEDKPKAIERLRANQTGTGTTEFKWNHIGEMFLEPKTYIFAGLSLLLNASASVTNTFGPLILSGLGFDKYTGSLLNIPFGFVQFVIIIFASWVIQRFRLKSVIIIAVSLPVIAGLTMLYVIQHNSANQPALIVGYYLLAFMYGGIPAIVAWMIANTAGTTKKSAIMSVYNAAASAGNIIGPLLFHTSDAPRYLPGLRKVLGLFVALVCCAILQVLNLRFLNTLQEKKRVKNGKPAKIVDSSMKNNYESLENAPGGENGAQGTPLGANAFLDLTDRQNDEFVSALAVPSHGSPSSDCTPGIFRILVFSVRANMTTRSISIDTVLRGGGAGASRPSGRPCWAAAFVAIDTRGQA